MGSSKRGHFSGRKVYYTPNNSQYFDKFFIIKRTSDKQETFSPVSPFLVQKAIAATLGEVLSIRKMRSGDLLVEISTKKQAQQIMKLKALAHIPVSVNPHTSLNFSKGVITCGELFNVSIEEITSEMKPQGVTHVRQITIRRNGQLLSTKHYILTFHSPNLPESIYSGYIKLPVRQYIPNPLRCFQCQRFGHSKVNCHGTLTCARCAEKGHDSQQSRRRIQNQTPTPGVSYAAIVQKSFCANCSCVNCKKESSMKLPEKTSNSDSEHSMKSVQESPQVDTSTKKVQKKKTKNSMTLKLAKRGISQKDLSVKLRKSASRNSVALGLANQGVVYKDLTSIFGDTFNNPDFKLHPSEDEDSLDMSGEDPATTTNAESLSSSKVLS
ncbi:uncharacterized protein LOC129975635 [Argiope bruennichi]|uniref:uncharacterized protein LOC129975635 n=1 Tax=Argiope bruennichi TaxID=94029 RepID=UPI00249452D5|nr:uncharacterized protein LOC129975635 [Argiope bruennichi]